jgi:hypothetical protein
MPCSDAAKHCGDRRTDMPVLQPTAETERHAILDVLRGFALYGVLLANLVWLTTDMVLTDARLHRAAGNPAKSSPLVRRNHASNEKGHHERHHRHLERVDPDRPNRLNAGNGAVQSRAAGYRRDEARDEPQDQADQNPR